MVRTGKDTRGGWWKEQYSQLSYGREHDIGCDTLPQESLHVTRLSKV